MASKIRGITIELNGDTTGLTKALEDANKSAKDTQKQLNDVNRVLKLDPSNVELLAQKQKLLADASETTAAKLEAMRKAQAALAENGLDENTQKQYDALSKEIVTCESQMKKLETATQQTSKEMAQAKFVSSDFGQALTKIGNTAQQVAEKTKTLSTVAAGAAAGLVGLAVKAGQTADDLLTLSQQTGLSTDTIQQMKYASDGIDVNFETISGAITRMKNNLDSTSGIWDKIGVKTKDAAGNYRDIEDIFNDSVVALGRIENETERDTYAMDLFGRSANELAGLLDDGGKKFRELGQQAQNNKLIIPEETLRKAGEFNDTLDYIKTNLAAAFSGAGAEMAAALVPIMESLGEVIQKVASFIAAIPQPVLQIILAITTLVALISPLARMISSVTTAVQGVLAVVPLVGAAIQFIQAQLTSLMANPIVLEVGAIIAVLALLGLAIYEVADNWDIITESVEDWWSTTKAKVSDIGGSIEDFAKSVAAKFKNVASNIKDIVDRFKNLGKSIKEVLSDAAAKFVEFVNKGRKWGSDLMDGFMAGIKSVIESIKRVVQNLVDSIKSIFDKGASDAYQSGYNTGKNYQQGLDNGQQANKKYYTPSYYTPSSSPYSNYSASSPSLNYSTVSLSNDSISMLGKALGANNVTVTLAGSASNIFDTVRVENTKLAKATGYHALA